MSWREAESLLELRSECDHRWPQRSKDSDGTIGDANHSARLSDHNPDVDGVVKAIDITHDPAHGCDSYALAEFLKSRRDPRIKYIISNRRICSSQVAPWTWRPYNGANPHDHHVHISVLPDRAHYDDQSSWGVYQGTMPIVDMPQPKLVPRTLCKGAQGQDVANLQAKLITHNITVAVDGDFGSQTQDAVRLFQEHSGIIADGVVGPQTWKALEN